MIEFLAEFLFEVLLQIGLEILAELGLHALREPLRGRPSAALAALGYLLFGAVVGGLSLLAAPTSMVRGEAARIGSLVVTPILAGIAMAAIGAWRSRRSEPVLRIDRFAYGYLFALAMALVRFFFAH